MFYIFEIALHVSLFYILTFITLLHFLRFQSAKAFNQDLSGWDTSNVWQTMTTFHLASAFNSDLTEWSVAKVTSNTNFLEGATAFQAQNRPGCCDPLPNSIPETSTTPEAGCTYTNTNFLEGATCVCLLRCPTGQTRFGDGSACGGGGLPNCDLGYCHSNPNSFSPCDSSTKGLRKVIKDYLSEPTNMLTKYGLIEDWDMSQVVRVSIKK